MGIKSFKPTSPSNRGTSMIDYSHLDRVEPLKSLTGSIKKNSGRNSQGRITVRHQGGGHDRRYRVIDFKRDKFDIPGRVEYLEYDPNRSAFIARILYKDGERRYILAPEGLKKGDEIISSKSDSDIKIGYSVPLSKIPPGTTVHNIEMYPGKGAQLARGAGASVQILGRVDGHAQLKLPSGEVRVVKENCMATVGQVSNLEYSNIEIGKAGRKRWMGIRPTVRGVAMNPVDHPHGGGEGKTSGGRHPCTPWAVCTKGYKTRLNKRTDKYIIRRRSKKGNVEA